MPPLRPRGPGAGPDRPSIDGDLFHAGDLTQWLIDRSAACLRELATIPIETVIALPTGQLCHELFAKYSVEAVQLHRERRTAHGPVETPVWGGGGLQTQHVTVRPGPIQPGYRTDILVPFTGEINLLELSPGPLGSPRPRGWLIADSKQLQFRFEWPRDSETPVEIALGPALDAIESVLEHQAPIVTTFLEELSRNINLQLTERRDGFLRACADIDGLRIPVYRNPTAPQTYAAPGIERRPVPAPSGSPARTSLEPTLVSDFYEHIISVITAMTRGMERTPGAYASWTEPQLRDALLVILNTHYSGQAMGEAFSSSGKTDILVRIADRNVFIGECKWWGGAKSFAGEDADLSAIDQLLSYATWRDAKLALAVFVDSKDIGAVIETASRSLAAHPGFLCWTDTNEEGELRARVRLRGGQDSVADLAVIFAHLPSSSADSEKLNSDE